MEIANIHAVLAHVADKHDGVLIEYPTLSVIIPPPTALQRNGLGDPAKVSLRLMSAQTGISQYSTKRRRATADMRRVAEPIWR